MNYPFTDAEWLREALPKTTLYRRVSVGLLTLGHLRTAEAVGVRLLTSAETAEKADFGLLVSICQCDWRKSLKTASKAGFWWRYRRELNTPRNSDELKSCVRWWKSQNYFPARTLLNSEESAKMNELSQKSVNRASSIVERLAMSVCKIDGWQTLTNCNSIWDVPMVAATHLLVAKAELEGAYHIPYDLIRSAKNGKSRIAT
jgi:hypothetical protein